MNGYERVKGITPQELSGNDAEVMAKYGDIIYETYTPRHTRMPLAKRAAQFLPFAALTGYEEAIAETGRLTEARRELSEEEKEDLDHRFAVLFRHIKERPTVEITIFEPDERKEGGRYVTKTVTVRRIDTLNRVLVDQARQAYPLDEIRSMEGKLFDRASKIGQPPE